MANPPNTKTVRTSNYADSLADQLVARANKLRKKQKKAPISKSKAIEVALENVSASMLAEA